MNLLSLRAATTTVSLRHLSFGLSVTEEAAKHIFICFPGSFSDPQQQQTKDCMTSFQSLNFGAIYWLIVFEHESFSLTGKRKCNKNGYLTPSFWTRTLQNETFYSDCSAACHPSHTSQFFLCSLWFFCWCPPLETLCTLIIPLFCSCLLQNKIKDTRLISVFPVFLPLSFIKCPGPFD